MSATAIPKRRQRWICYPSPTILVERFQVAHPGRLDVALLRQIEAMAGDVAHDTEPRDVALTLALLCYLGAIVIDDVAVLLDRPLGETSALVRLGRSIAKQRGALATTGPAVAVAPDPEPAAEPAEAAEAEPATP